MKVCAWWLAVLLWLPAVASAQDSDVPEDQNTETSAPSFLDNFHFDMFVDGYYAVDWNRPELQTATSLVPHRAYVQTNGFALSFVGLNLAYDAEVVGATVDLRFGPSTPRLLGPVAPLTLDNVKQAFVTWRPMENLSLDFGQFDTIYGAEVADSYANLNYTRGALYFLMQPFYHTGLRAHYQVNEQVGVTGLLVNGVNNPIDNNESPDVGVQVQLTPMPDTSLAVGYLLSPFSSDNKDLNHFFDVVGTWARGPVAVVFNADLGLRDVGTETATYYGVSLAGRYAFTNMFAGALRGEFLRDQDGVFYGFPDGLSLVTATATLEAMPIPNRSNLVIRLENRLEWANEEIFPKSDFSGFPAASADVSDVWFTTVLGLVVKTGG